MRGTPEPAACGSCSSADLPSLELDQAPSQVAQTLGDALLVLDEREAHEALAARAEAGARGQGDLAVAVFVDVGESGSRTAGPILETFLRAA